MSHAIAIVASTLLQHGASVTSQKASCWKKYSPCSLVGRVCRSWWEVVAIVTIAISIICLIKAMIVGSLFFVLTSAAVGALSYFLLKKIRSLSTQSEIEKKLRADVAALEKETLALKKINLELSKTQKALNTQVDTLTGQVKQQALENTAYKDQNDAHEKLNKAQFEENENLKKQVDAFVLLNTAMNTASTEIITKAQGILAGFSQENVKLNATQEALKKQLENFISTASEEQNKSHTIVKEIEAKFDENLTGLKSILETWQAGNSAKDLELLSKTREQQAEFEKQKALVKQQVDFLEAQKNKLETTIASLETKIAALEKKHETFLEGLDKKITGFATQFSTTQGKFEMTSDELTNFASEIKKYVSNMMHLQSSNSMLPTSPLATSISKLQEPLFT